MVKLIAISPCAGLLPIAFGGVEVTEVLPLRLMSVAPFAGQRKVVSDRLKEQVGSGLAALNRRSGAVSWFGPPLA